MQTFHVALLQILPEDTLQKNLHKGIEACKKAQQMGADLALFPEMWSNGYHIPQDMTELKAQAISPEGEFVQAFKALAKELNMAIGITFLESFQPLPRNTLTVFDRFGKQVLSYAKVHTCDFAAESRLTPGNDFYTATLDIQQGSVAIGAMICYDREFPESARILMLQGAEVVLVPNACPMEINRISQLRGRAYENMFGIATANYPAGRPDCNGNSTAFDGIAYKPDEPGSRDTLILQADENEGIFMASFPLHDMRQYRASEVHGNAYRRPGCYKQLLDKKVKAPFQRPDARR